MSAKPFIHKDGRFELYLVPATRADQLVAQGKALSAYRGPWCSRCGKAGKNLREVVRQWDEATESEADLSHMLPSPGWSVKV